MTVLFLASCVFNDDCFLSKYKNADPSIVTEMINQIGEDIYSTWKSSCTNLPHPELIILGLLKVANKIACKNKIEFADTSILFDVLGLTPIMDDDECEECNGSNKTEHPLKEDRDMKDLLKD